MLAVLNRYFTPGEKALWLFSVALITLSFFAFGSGGGAALAASLIGVTSLLLNAKGNPLGQALAILFSCIYGAISWRYRYFGEMITYLGMTAPMAALALAAWLRHPYKGDRAQVQVNRLGRRELAGLVLLTGAVTVVFGFLLRALGTANLAPSILSVSTSFAAVYLTWRRSPWFAVAYAANDLVLIVLWSLAAAADPEAVSVLICFVVFFANDLYGFCNWRRMMRRQAA